MKTMEVSRGQYTRQFRAPASTHSSPSMFKHNSHDAQHNGEDDNGGGDNMIAQNSFFAVQGLNEVNLMDILHQMTNICF